MPDVGRRAQAIRDRIDAAKLKRAAAEHEVLVARAGVESALAQLREEFGVDRIEDADELLRQLDEQAAAECARIEALLAEEGIA